MRRMARGSLLARIRTGAVEQAVSIRSIQIRCIQVDVRQHMHTQAGAYAPDGSGVGQRPLEIYLHQCAEDRELDGQAFAFWLVWCVYIPTLPSFAENF